MEEGKRMSVRQTMGSVSTDDLIYLRPYCKKQCME